MKESGFVTIATGSMKYYWQARNLLLSFRETNKYGQFAIITDQDNPYVHEYDDAVILDSPHNSYLDKLALLIKAPYRRNIFLDSDSLIYSDLSYLWNLFGNTTPFSAFGKEYPLDDTSHGWYTIDSIGNYAAQVHYIGNLHGGLYYIERGESCERMYHLCMDIMSHYEDFRFALFQKPADEPIIALAAACMNMRLCDRIDSDICFYPIADRIIRCRLGNGVDYRFKRRRIHGSIIHFSSSNTQRAFYKNQIRILEVPHNRLINGIQYRKDQLTDFHHDFPTVNAKVYACLPAMVKKYIDCLRTKKLKVNCNSKLH